MAYTEITNKTSPNRTAGRSGAKINAITIHSDMIRERNCWIRVDPEFEYLLYENVWSDSGGYAKRYKERFDGVKRHRWVEYLHKIILNTGRGQVVDHINQDRSDNRRSNLRVVSKAINALNTSKPRGFVERTLKNGSKRYDVRLVFNGDIIISKTFNSETEAVDAYNNTKKEVIAYGV